MVGTAEFVAPEVVSYDDISINTGKAAHAQDIVKHNLYTDQWSLGVVAFILLSGASPFLSEDQDDQSTLNNVAMLVTVRLKHDFISF